MRFPTDHFGYEPTIYLPKVRSTPVSRSGAEQVLTCLPSSPERTHSTNRSRPRLATSASLSSRLSPSSRTHLPGATSSSMPSSVRAHAHTPSPACPPARGWVSYVRKGLTSGGDRARSGFSFQPPLREPFTEVLPLLAETQIPILSVDIPSVRRPFSSSTLLFLHLQRRRERERERKKGKPAKFAPPPDDLPRKPKPHRAGTSPTGPRRTARPSARTRSSPLRRPRPACGSSGGRGCPRAGSIGWAGDSSLRE